MFVFTSIEHFSISVAFSYPRYPIFGLTLLILELILMDDKGKANEQATAKRINEGQAGGTSGSTADLSIPKRIVGGGTLQQPIEFAEESVSSRSLKTSPINEKGKINEEPRVQISSNVKAVSYEDDSGIKYPPGGQFYSSTSPSSAPEGSLPMDELAMKSRGLVDSEGHHKRVYPNEDDAVWKDKISAYPFTPSAAIPCDDVKLGNRDTPIMTGGPTIDQDLLEKDLPPLITMDDEVKAFDLSNEAFGGSQYFRDHYTDKMQEIKIKRIKMVMLQKTRRAFQKSKCYIKKPKCCGIACEPILFEADEKCLVSYGNAYLQIEFSSIHVLTSSYFFTNCFFNRMICTNQHFRSHLFYLSLPLLVISLLSIRTVDLEHNMLMITFPLFIATSIFYWEYEAKVISCFVLPHGGLALNPSGFDSTDVAKEQVRRINQASIEVGRCIKHHAPDVVVLSTPHGIADIKNFAFYEAPNAKGSVETDNCSCPPCCYDTNATLDTSFTKILLNNLTSQGLNVTGISFFGNETAIIKWGEVVPLLFIGNRAKAIIISHPTRRYFELKSMIPELLDLGKKLYQVLEETSLKVVVVISSDLAHTHDVGGPYGFSTSAAPFDQSCGQWASTLSPNYLLGFAAMHVEKALSCGYSGLVMLHGLMEAGRLDSWLSKLYANFHPSYYGMMVASFVRNTTF